MMFRKTDVEQRTRPFSIENWVRIISSNHAPTPIGVGYGSSRFSSTSRAFRVLYAADDFATAFAETVVRDRFVGKRRRVLYKPMLEALSVTVIASNTEVRLLDITGAGSYHLGLDTDAASARDHTQGQLFSEWLNSETAVDGILYDSRITKRNCVAVYDRALGKMTGTPAVDLITQPELANEIDKQRISVRARYVPRI